MEVCPRCGGAMTVLGFITEQPVVRRIFAHLECCVVDTREDAIGSHQTSQRVVLFARLSARPA